MSGEKPILELKDINLRHRETRALSDLTLDLKKGEIHALVGEHRSGKSSITKLLGGILRKDSGSISLNGKIFDHFTPASSMRNKIGIIYQEADLIPSLSGVENIYAGRLMLGFLNIINNRKMIEEVTGFLDGWGLSIDLKTPVGRLPKADQHKLELVRAVFFDPDILIFDELSNKLNSEEMEMAYQLILDLKNRGKSILYISNNMNEIFEFADRVSVLKNGRVISTQEIRNVDKVRLIDMTYSLATTREELRKRNEELYNYKKYNEDIINNLPLGVIILDQEKNIYLINYSTLSILSLEYRAGETDFNKIIEGLPKELRTEIISSVNKREDASWEELDYGENQYLNITVFPFRDEDYVFLGTIILIQDISKDYHFKNYLLQTERISSVAELAAGVAHEVNNPLGIVLNYVELLKIHQIDGYSSEKISLIKSELNRIKSIIGSLLSFSHLNETPMRSLDITAVMEDTLLLINHQFKEKNTGLEWKKPDTPVMICGNENRLKQVIINIVINGIEAVGNEGTISITIEPSKEKGWADIIFSNNGEKIPEEIRSNIFNPFYTTKEAGQNTGLGLSICRHIIEAHQGLLTCDSTEQETCFRVRLPLVE